jgi:hypothetical protein
MDRARNLGKEENTLGLSVPEEGRKPKEVEVENLHVRAEDVVEQNLALLDELREAQLVGKRERDKEAKVEEHLEVP